MSWTEYRLRKILTTLNAGENPPAEPKDNQLWLSLNDYSLSRWNGTKWAKAVEISVSTENELIDLINKAGSNLQTAVISEKITLTADITFPSNILLKFLPGGMLDGNVTATINGGIDAGLYQIFGNDLILAGNPKLGVIYPQWFGTKNNGVDDDSTSLQKAINFAESVGELAILYLAGLDYPIQSGLNVNQAINIKNGKITALSGFSSATGFLISIEESAEGAVLENILLDGGLNSDNSRNADLIKVSAKRTVISNVKGVHFPNYGIQITSSCQENIFENIVLKEWLWSEAGRTDGSLRTAKCIEVGAYDLIFSNVVCATSKYPLYISENSGSCLYNNCHFYNGGSTTIPNEEVVFIDVGVGKNTGRNHLFNNCSFDNGSVRIKNQFSQSFINCFFLQTSYGTNESAFYFQNDDTANSNMAGLIVVGCKFNGNWTTPIKKVGNFVEDKWLAINWSNNIKTDGSVFTSFPAMKLNGLTYSNGEMIVNSNTDSFNLNSMKSIKISADYDSNSGQNQSEIYFATDGVDRWKISYLGNLIPLSAGTNTVGNETYPMKRIVSNWTQLKEGASDSPWTPTGYASLFINTNGELCVKFSNGVIKVLANNV